MTTQVFSTLPLKAELLSTLNDIGYKNMTPIQAESLPSILEGKDVIGQGKTGSGKTAAFGLGLLNRLNVKRFRVQSLVLCLPGNWLTRLQWKSVASLAESTTLKC